MDDQINIDLSFHRKIAEKLSNHGVTLFGVADLNGISTLPDQSGHSFPRALPQGYFFCGSNGSGHHGKYPTLLSFS
jgi:hypothetical protein